MDRAFDYGSKGCRFDSCRARDQVCSNNSWDIYMPFSREFMGYEARSLVSSSFECFWSDKFRVAEGTEID